jgi:guanine deaminase
MNRNCPDYYCEASVESSIVDTRDLITYIRGLSPISNGKKQDLHPLVQPVITPRFALSCTSELMESLGELMSSEPDVHIQTHLSENRTEIKETLRSFPECSSYTEVYERHGMLRDGTILAHCVWLTDEEMDIIKRTGAGISHCPTSNFNLMSGGAKVGAMLDKGLNVS